MTRQYKLTSDEEPTDEDINIILEAAHKEVLRKNEESKAKEKIHMHQLLAEAKLFVKQLMENGKA